jgi:hypothetical protein
MAGRRHAVVGLLGLVSVISACNADRAIGPEQSALAPAQNLTGLVSTATNTANNLIYKTGLGWKVPVQAPITRSITVTKDGGTLLINELGFRLTIPRNAISTTSLTIKVTALPGAAVAYSFEPHGTQFKAALTISQDLAFTKYQSSLASKLGAGYFKDNAQVNPSTGVIGLDELLKTSIASNRVSFGVTHFSGYMVSMD